MTTASATDLRDLAVGLAATGAERLRARAGAPDLRVATKSTETDPVTEVDRQVEAELVARLADLRPDDGVLGEEGTRREGRSGVEWLIDPIDGTVDFLYGIPGCNVSVAASVDGVVVAGAVVDPLHGDTFAAARGHGATRNGTQVRCTRASDPAHALVGTGFAYSPAERARQADVLARVLPRIRDIRRVGAAAIDLCWVACGRLDGYYERNLRPWDWAAGSLIAEEAGARVTALGGGSLPGDLPDACIVAAGPDLHPALAALLTEAGEPAPGPVDPGAPRGGAG